MIAKQDGLAARIRALRDKGDQAALARIGAPEMAAGLAAEPDRADLTLMIAAAQAMLGQDKAASATLDQALAWGCDRHEAATRLLPAARHWLAQAAKGLGAARTEDDVMQPVSPAVSYLFLGGTPRSGTTGLVDLLNAHPEVLVGDERYARIWRQELITPSHFTAAHFLGHHPYDEGRIVHGRETLAESMIRRNYAAKFLTANVIGDKFPFVLDHLDMLFERFVPCKVVAILRNPVSVGESGQARYDDPEDKQFNMDGQTLIDRWNKAMRLALDACTAGRPVIVLCYERLVRHKQAADRLFETLGLDPAKADAAQIATFYAQASQLNSALKSKDEQLRFRLMAKANLEAYRVLRDEHCILRALD